jgi:hypothetical protein
LDENHLALDKNFIIKPATDTNPAVTINLKLKLKIMIPNRINDMKQSILSEEDDQEDIKEHTKKKNVTL